MRFWVKVTMVSGRSHMLPCHSEQDANDVVAEVGQAVDQNRSYRHERGDMQLMVNGSHVADAMKVERP